MSSIAPAVGALDVNAARALTTVDLAARAASERVSNQQSAAAPQLQIAVDRHTTASPVSPAAEAHDERPHHSGGRSVTSTASYSSSGTVTGFPLDVVRQDGSYVTIQPSTGSFRDVSQAVTKAAALGIDAVALRVGPDNYRLQLTSTRTGPDEGDFALRAHRADEVRRSDGTTVDAAASDGFDGKDYYAVNSVPGDAAARWNAVRQHEDSGFAVVPTTSTTAATVEAVEDTTAAVPARERVVERDAQLEQKRERYQAYHPRLESALGELKDQADWLSGQLVG